MKPFHIEFILSVQLSFKVFLEEGKGGFVDPALHRVQEGCIFLLHSFFWPLRQKVAEARKERTQKENTGFSARCYTRIASIPRARSDSFSRSRKRTLEERGANFSQRVRVFSRTREYKAQKEREKEAHATLCGYPGSGIMDESKRLEEKEVSRNGW